MKRIACVRLRNWPIDRLCRRRRELRLNPLALIQTVTNRRLVAAACDKARAHGVRPGIDQAEANAVCPSLVCLPHDLAADARGLRSLGRWMMRFTPLVSVAGGPDDPMGTPDAVLLDLTGCERVFHGLNRLIHKIAVSIERFELDARIAIAPTPGAAWAMTFAPSDSFDVRCSIFDVRCSNSKANTEHRIEEIPCEALRLDDDTVAKLYHLGIRTIGQLLRFPREQLPARFGPMLTLRLDQLLGRVPEPLVPLDPLNVISARMEFDGVVTSLEAIWVVFRDLLGRVIAQLERRGRGVRELNVRFDRNYAPPLIKTICLSRPSRDPVNLFNLFRCATEQLDAGAQDGFAGMRLVVRVHEPLPHEQVDLLDGENYAGEIELDRLIERLCARLGEESIAQAKAVELHVPERAYRLQLARDSRRHSGRASFFDEDAHERHPPNSVRPLCLLPQPVEVRVTVDPSNDAFGRPMQFVRHTGHVHRLTQTLGPERIGGQWWDGHHKTRDYYDVEDQTGQRFWLFRVNETRRWFLHGRFS